MGKSWREIKSRERKQERDLHPRRNPHKKLVDEERELETREEEKRWQKVWEDISDG